MLGSAGASPRVALVRTFVPYLALVGLSCRSAVINPSDVRMAWAVRWRRDCVEWLCAVPASGRVVDVRRLVRAAQQRPPYHVLVGLSCRSAVISVARNDDEIRLFSPAALPDTLRQLLIFLFVIQGA